MRSVQEDGVGGFVDRRSPVEVFSACPTSVGIPAKSYVKRVRELARWCERHGCRGALVPADNRLVDPWVVSLAVVQATRAFSPLVAVQPASMHPFTVANMIATISSLYGRRVFVDWVAGGTTNDLSALADDTPHADRYDRLVEYASIVRQLTDGATVTFKGRFYEVRGLKLRQPVDASLRPEFMVPGTSPAGRLASQTLKARSLTYALPPEEDHLPPLETGVAAGLRVGIIARNGVEEAWRVAFTRFPPDGKGPLARQLVRRTSGPHWHESVERLASERAKVETPYWTQPFESYQTMCPYLVGSHEQVATALSRYVQRGFGTFILDAPHTETDADSFRIVFEHARRSVLEAA